MKIDFYTTRVVYQEEDVELYLNQGWILISVRTETRNGPDGEQSMFRALVGWPLRKGTEVAPPQKREMINVSGVVVDSKYPFGW